MDTMKALMDNIIDEDDIITKRDNQHKLEMKLRKKKQAEAKSNFQEIFLPLLDLPTIRSYMSNTQLLSLEQDEREHRLSRYV